ALSHAYSKGTLASYSSALPKYIEFCDKMCVPPSDRFPATAPLVCSFVIWCSSPMNGVHPDLAPSQSVSINTAEHYVSGLKAWHLLNGFPWIWEHRPDELTLYCKGIARQQGTLFKAAVRPAVTLKMILLLVDKLDHSNCFDAAVLACAIITFFSLFRLGETTVRSHKSF
ncbi:hypothetical protein BT69DRAFT_1197685, partial [Atractiella rhizophila]